MTGSYRLASDTMKRGSILIILLFLLGALAACGDDDDEDATPTTRSEQTDENDSGDEDDSEEASGDPEEWVRSLCTEITDWQGDLEGLAGNLESGLGDVSDLSVARDQLVQFVGSAVTATDEMLNGVEGLGAPDVEDGEEIANEIQSGLADLRQVFIDGQERAADLPVDNPAAFASEAEALGTDISEAGDEIAANFEALDNELRSEELDRAFDDEPACAAINTP